ncbi:MAG: PAS domain S-box protein [Bacteroidia bacterium]|nr:PAS domain S-box protein [Bacteroidia bacterium]
MDRNLYGIVELDRKGVIRDLNPDFCDILNFEPEELLGLNLSYFIPPGKEFQLHQWLDQQAAGLLEKQIFQWDLMKKDGKRVRVKFSLIKDLREDKQSDSAAILALSSVSENDLLHQFLNLLNITQKEEFSGNIFERLAKGIAEALPIPYVIIGEYQREEENILAKAFWAKDHLRESSYKLEDTPCELIFEHRAPVFFPRNIQTLFPKDTFLQDKILHSYYGLPLFDSAEEIIGHLVMFGEEEMELDWIPETTLIHFSRHVAFELERSIYEDRQVQSLKRFQTLAQNAPMGICLCSTEGIIQFTNPAYSQIIGYEIPEIQGQAFKKFTHEDDVNSNLGLFKEVVSGEKTSADFVKRYIHKNGEIIYVKMTISRMLLTGEKEIEVIAIIENISEQVFKDQEVKRINKAFEQQRLLMLEGERVSKSSSWIFDLESKKLTPSPGLPKLYELEEFSKNPDELYQQIISRLSSDDLAKIQAVASKSKDLKESQSLDYQIHLPDGHSKWLRSTYTNWDQGTKLMGTTKDVTLEINTLNELIKTQDELEQWIYSVTHDLRTPLAHIEGFSEWLMEEAKDKLSTEGISYLQGIISASERIDLMTRDLLEYAWTRKVSLQRSWVDLNKVLRNSRKSIAPKRSFPHIQWEISRLPKVYADKSMMYSMMDNLISNAIKYSQDSDPPIIKIWAEEEPNKVFVHFQDNGVGFDMKEADRLFNFFERLHTGQKYTGSGVGLANVQQILLRHEGNISAKGEIGKGAVFTICLPMNHCK